MLEVRGLRRIQDCGVITTPNNAASHDMYAELLRRKLVRVSDFSGDKTIVKIVDARIPARKHG